LRGASEKNAPGQHLGQQLADFVRPPVFGGGSFWCCAVSRTFPINRSRITHRWRPDGTEIGTRYVWPPGRVALGCSATRSCRQDVDGLAGNPARGVIDLEVE